MCASFRMTPPSLKVSTDAGLRLIPLLVKGFRKMYKLTDEQRDDLHKAGLTLQEWSLIGQGLSYPDTLVRGNSLGRGKELAKIGSKLIGVRSNHDLDDIREHMPPEEQYAPEGFWDTYARPIEPWD